MTTLLDTAASVGKDDFIARHRLWSAEQQEAAQRVRSQLREHDIRFVRVTMVDPHGKQRGKTLLADAFEGVLRNGVDFSTAAYHFDTADAIVYDAFQAGGGLGISQMSGFPDAVLVPDPTTFRILPWAPKTAWVIGDIYFDDGTPMPFDARSVLKQSLETLGAAGYQYLAGLEVEFYLTRVVSTSLAPDQLGGPGQPAIPPVVEAVANGYCYQSDDHQDQIEEILAVLADNILGVDLPLRTMEDEWGPGQCEFTFAPMLGLAGADAMMLFKSTVKQVSRRMGLHATFMCRPGLPSFFSSGWHLHQSLVGADGTNAFATPEGSTEAISPVGRNFVGGILEHATAASVLTTPTVNGYRRRKPFSLAPDRATWGHDNRAAMVRLQGGPGDPSTHVENRVGEPAANPYLYLASQVVAGLDGLDRGLDPGPFEVEPYSATERPLLPTSLGEALSLLKASTVYREAFGDAFVDWYVGLKESEVNRFLAAEPNWEDDPDTVTTWEHNEYFSQY
ncbi:MAG: glutamine synthetase family protein [Actinomycetota bacterium]|nr:glutamine synthetase family protein [Actinomycetota bacterium]